LDHLRERVAISARSDEMDFLGTPEEGCAPRMRKRKVSIAQTPEKREATEEEVEEDNEEEAPVRGPVISDKSTAKCTYYKSFTWKGM